MTRAKAVSGIVGALLLLTIVSSVRADVVHRDMQLEKLLYAENHNLIGVDFQLEETGYLYAGHFEKNNGKHLGFSMSAVNHGPNLGIVRGRHTASTSQNPEPATMVLLGTGLAGAAFARRKRRNRGV